MLAQVEAALRALQQAQDAVGEAEQSVRDAKARIPAVRQKLYDAIVQAARDGARQRELVEATGYTRETIRRILRAGGIDADER